MNPITSGILLNTPKPCSCFMCGNPRRTLMENSPLTLQELKALDSFKDQIEDWENTDE